MNITKTEKFKKISLILVLVLVLTQFTGLVPASAAVPGISQAVYGNIYVYGNVYNSGTGTYSATSSKVYGINPDYYFYYPGQTITLVVYPNPSFSVTVDDLGLSGGTGLSVSGGVYTYVYTLPANYSGVANLPITFTVYGAVYNQTVQFNALPNVTLPAGITSNLALNRIDDFTNISGLVFDSVYGTLAFKSPVNLAKSNLDLTKGLYFDTGEIGINTKYLAGLNVPATLTIKNVNLAPGAGADVIWSYDFDASDKPTNGIGIAKLKSNTVVHNITSKTLTFDVDGFSTYAIQPGLYVDDIVTPNSGNFTVSGKVYDLNSSVFVSVYSGSTKVSGPTEVSKNNTTGTFSTNLNLASGTYTIWVKADNGSIYQEQKQDITVNAPSTTTTTSSSSTTTPTPTTTTTTTTAPVSLSTATTVATSTVNGQTVATVAVDEAKALTVLNANPTAKVFTVEVNQTAAVAKAEVPSGLITALINKGASIEVKATTGAYTLPAAEIKVADLAKLLGAKDADIKITVVIAEAKTEQVSAVQKAAANKGLTQLVTPVEFKVEAVAGDKKVEVNNFSSYVSRQINLSKAIDAAAAVGVVLNADGTLSPVPTQFKTENGKTVAVIKRKTNSVYTVVENKKTFADVSSHWAKDDVNTLASKLIIAGMSENAFGPDKKVTRAEFAAIIVKALGLTPNAANASFSDVKAGDWYTGAVGAAVDAGIIKGYANGTFKPNAYVTREEVAAMVVQALKVAGQDTAITDAETDQSLAQFKDGAKVASWAKSAVAVAAKNGIIKGDTKGAFAPVNNSTRAESAVMVKKMLTKANFI